MFKKIYIYDFKEKFESLNPDGTTLVKQARIGRSY